MTSSRLAEIRIRLAKTPATGTVPASLAAELLALVDDLRDDTDDAPADHEPDVAEGDVPGWTGGPSEAERVNLQEQIRAEQESNRKERDAEAMLKRHGAVVTTPRANDCGACGGKGYISQPDHGKRLCTTCRGWE